MQITFVFCATRIHMTIANTCSSLATSVQESGPTCRLTGLVALLSINAFLWPGKDLLKASSLRWCSRQLGTFGFFEMEGHSEGKDLRLVLGVVNLYMI